MTIRTQYLKISYILDALVELKMKQKNKEDRQPYQDIIYQVIDLSKDIRHTSDPIAAIMEAEKLNG